MFEEIKQFIAIKSPNKKGILEGIEDMIKEGKVPCSKPFKHKKEWILIMVEYNKIATWQIN